MTLFMRLMATRQGEQRSYIGGQPHMPPAIVMPRCDLCGSEQTFFFQIALPEGHCRAGETVALFQCTECAQEDTLIPAMIEGSLKGATIARDFLRGYQRNFRVLFFPTGESVVRSAYRERIAFAEIRLSTSARSGGSFFKRASATNLGQLGGAPDWVMEDEHPGGLEDGTPLSFLLQVETNVAIRYRRGGTGTGRAGFVWETVSLRR